MQAGNGTPHVTGVRLDSGETLQADLVVDAMGRGSPLPRWCSDADIGPLHEESEDSGFIYYGRFFRSADGTTPQPYRPSAGADGDLLDPDSPVGQRHVGGNDSSSRAETRR